MAHGCNAIDEDQLPDVRATSEFIEEVLATNDFPKRKWLFASGFVPSD
jgi:hypothetical protein